MLVLEESKWEKRRRESSDPERKKQESMCFCKQEKRKFKKKLVLKLKKDRMCFRLFLRKKETSFSLSQEGVIPSIRGRAEEKHRFPTINQTKKESIHRRHFFTIFLRIASRSKYMSIFFLAFFTKSERIPWWYFLFKHETWKNTFRFSECHHFLMHSACSLSSEWWLAFFFGNVVPAHADFIPLRMRWNPLLLTTTRQILLQKKVILVKSFFGFWNYFLRFAGLIAVAFVIFAGFLMLTAGGNDDQVGRGKTILIWAAGGIIVILLSWALVQFVAGIFQ